MAGAVLGRLGRAPPYGVASQSALIILREGFEVVLVVGALLAIRAQGRISVVRAPILYGTWPAGWPALSPHSRCCSSSTPPAQRLKCWKAPPCCWASAVLFFGSYWLISKAEADRGSAPSRARKHALATGNALALGGAAFLAVYRERHGNHPLLHRRSSIRGGRAPAVAVGFASAWSACGRLRSLPRIGSPAADAPFVLRPPADCLYYLAVASAAQRRAELQGAGWVTRRRSLGAAH